MSKVHRLFIVPLCVSNFASAQPTIVDLVENAGEKRAFIEIAREQDALKKRSAATRYLKDFPRSFLTAQVLEAAAKSSADLGDGSSAISYARQSLKIYPENPGLLIPLAAWRSARGDTAGSRAAAQEGLRLLELFTSPDGKIREELRAAALAIFPDTSAPLSLLRQGTYAGTAACGNCHARTAAAWRKTGMANMLRPINKARVIGDFGYRGGSGSGFRTGIAGGPFIELRRRNGTWDRFTVDFTIGSKWQQAYAVKTPRNGVHVLPVQYNSITGQWLNYWKTIDPPGSDRAETGDFHQLRRVTSYQANCAQCHTSQSNETGYAEEGVNCEMCHGPSAAHARGGAVAFRFGKATPEESVRVCAQCHAQSVRRHEKLAFPPAYRRRPYVEFAPRAFYRDGRFRETTFIVEAFERSACYRKGGATCVSCHDPHPADAAVNVKSLKFGGGDRMCTQCHAQLDPALHSRHKASSEGARCVSCHMPKIMGALLFQAGSHQIDDKPSAELNARFGQAESPNACLLCHKDRDNPWLQEQLRSWR